MKKMKITKFSIYSLLVIMTSFMLVFSACNNHKADGDTDGTDTTVQINAYEELTGYLSANSMDLSDMLNEWIITAGDVNEAGIENYYIIDLRKSEDFAIGHIPGSVNTTLADILTTAEAANDKPILVVCYSGQSAAHGMVGLRLSGYTESQVLKFGISSWNGDLDKWSSHTGDVADGNENWSTTNTITPSVEFSSPTITSEDTTAAEILAERVDVMLSGGFSFVTNEEVLADPSNYFINNYWTEEDVSHYGHIVGAYRIKENLSIAEGGFKNIDPDKVVVTYCWTGQTSSVVTAYLTVLGFNAKSLKFGANGMIHTQLSSHKWKKPGNFPYDSNE